MFTRFVISWMFVALAATSAVGQDTSEPSRVAQPEMKDVPPLDKKPAKSTVTLDALMIKMDEQFKQTNQWMAEGFKDLQTLRSDVDQLITTQNERGTELTQLKEKLDEIDTTLNLKIEEQRLLLDAIAGDDDDGNPILRLDSVMQSPLFRNQMSKAVNDSIQSEGELVVTNKMAGAQVLDVNGRQVSVEPGDPVKLKVPVGTDTTRLPGQDLQNWTVGAPNYRQEIDIVPRQNVSNRITVLRPEDTTSYYVDSSPTTTVYSPIRTVYSTPATTTYSVPITTYSGPNTAYYYSPSYAYYPYTSYYWPYWGGYVY